MGRGSKVGNIEKLFLLGIYGRRVEDWFQIGNSRVGAALE
jgi:hypothetical protein